MLYASFILFTYLTIDGFANHHCVGFDVGNARLIYAITRRAKLFYRLGRIPSKPALPSAASLSSDAPASEHNSSEIKVDTSSATGASAAASTAANPVFERIPCLLTYGVHQSPYVVAVPAIALDATCGVTL